MSEKTTAAAVDYVNALCAEANAHRAVNHPYLALLAAGDVPDPRGALRDFVFQYSAYCLDFVRYLTATIAQLEREPHRKAILKNLVEERGIIDAENAALLGTIGIELEWVNGIPHTELFKRSMAALGVDDAYVRGNSYCDDAVVWRELFFNLCSKEGAPRALGAIGLATENIVKFIYRPLIVAIRTHADVALRDRVFFDLHAALDDQHGDALTKVACDYAVKEENRQPLREGMLMALSLRGAFFDQLHARALAMRPA
jgi:pyrroloquinoline quinone (PQQ) biosynthesis protein C